jgi:RNA polymerase subunit RPABC4/transcription elongation factor Spt4
MNLLIWVLLIGGIGFIVYRIIQNRKQETQRNARFRGVYPAMLFKQCSNCGAPVEEAYLRCPECHYKLKTNCLSCGKVINTKWDICPYCETELKK